MKSALIYLEDRTQVVLTPETEQEKTIIALFKAFQERKPRLCFGDFYGCQGGFSRFSKYVGSSEQSVIIVFDKEKDREAGG